MSQLPPTPPMGAPMYNPQPQKGNLAAVLSLICGILLCIPGLGVLATILGIAGIVKSNKPNTGGKGMAIAGLILGIIGLIWTGFFALGGAGVYMAWKMGGPVRDAGKHFIVDVSSGNADAAIADCTSDVSPETVKATVEDAKSWGALKDTTFFSFNVDQQNGTKKGVVAGLATFANTKKSVQATLVEKDGTYKVAEYTFTAAQ